MPLRAVRSPAYCQAARRQTGSAATGKSSQPGLLSLVSLALGGSSRKVAASASAGWACALAIKAAPPFQITQVQLVGCKWGVLGGTHSPGGKAAIRPQCQQVAGAPAPRWPVSGAHHRRLPWAAISSVLEQYARRCVHARGWCSHQAGVGKRGQKGTKWRGGGSQGGVDRVKWLVRHRKLCLVCTLACGVAAGGCASKCQQSTAGRVAAARLLSARIDD